MKSFNQIHRPGTDRVLLWCMKTAEVMLGIVSLSIGSTLGILAGLGQTTSTSTFSAISGALHIKVGTAMFLLYGVFLAFQFLLLGKEFQITRLLQLIPSAVKGYVLNFFRYEFAPFQMLNPQTYGERFILFAIGMAFISFGFAATKCAEFVNYPPESFCTVAANKMGIRFGTFKIFLDFAYVGATALICLVSGQDLGIIREGTIIFAFANGGLINLFSPYIKKSYAKVEALAEQAASKAFGTARADGK